MAVPISNVTRRVVFAASGTGPYSFTFEILASTDIAVYKDDTLLTLTTDYTVTINANGTGYVTLVASPTGATQIAIVGNRTIQRTTDFVTGGDFFANTVNDEMDQQTIFAQQNAEGLSRALQAPQTDPTTINMILPRAALRAGKNLAFDSNGNPTLGDTLGTNRGNWASGTLYYVRDIVKDTSNSNIYQCLTQHTSSGSQPISTNTDAAKWFLLVDAASAGASASAAAASASAAATSASNASTSASNAASSASTASTQASNASTSATNAASSATAAAGSASTASTAATNASNSATAAATSATNASNSASAASTSATNASNSASAASTSASNASTSATNAANSATSASSSASTATTQATNAASSATAAAASAAAAAASFDAFDDIYLGAKSSDPSVDNDGNALTTGDQYFNTTANELRVYNGSTWQAASTVGGTVTSLSVTGNTTLGDATADSVTVNAGTLNFAQTGQRITGDFSNATLANRVAFQTSTTNGPTQITAMPNGTSTQSQFTAVSGTDLNNANGVQIRATSTEAAVMAYNTGSASALPMTFYTGGSERMRIDTSGNVGIGTSSPACKADVAGVVRATSTGAPASGVGLELSYGGTANTADILSYDRTGAAFKNLELRCSNLIFNTGGGGERMRIDSSGNVGIGTSSPEAKTSIVSAAGAIGLTVKDTNAGAANYFSVQYNGTSGVADVKAQSSGGSTTLAFSTSSSGTTSERMRIDSSGRMGLGTSSPDSNYYLTVGVTSSDTYAAARFNRGTTSSTTSIAFANPNGVVGSISTSGTSTAYNTSSDYRLKHDIAPMTGALAKVAALKPVTYKWKTDGSDGEGFIAHELAEVAPQCVTGEKDAVDADGNPVYQGIDTSFLVATLTAAIQEQQAIINAQQAALTALTARVTALEGTQP